jgi:hypothetical protein
MLASTQRLRATMASNGPLVNAISIIAKQGRNVQMQPAMCVIYARFHESLCAGLPGRAFEHVRMQHVPLASQLPGSHDLAYLSDEEADGRVNDDAAWGMPYTSVWEEFTLQQTTVVPGSKKSTAGAARSQQLEHHHPQTPSDEPPMQRHPTADVMHGAGP